MVALKRFENSRNVTLEFFEELKSYYQCDNSKNQKFYGVLPYVAPEILRGEDFTSAADVYSFSMIMWHISTGIPPFHDKSHNNQLAIDICNGTRPKILPKIPKSFSTLMERCWDADPLLRPSVQEITAMLFRWHFHLEQNRSIDICNAFKKDFDDIVDTPIDIQFHPDSKYISQLLDFKDLPEPQNYFSRHHHNHHYNDSGYGSSTNTLSSFKQSEESSLASQSQNISKISINSLGNSDEAKISLRKTPTYAESLRKQYQASTFYYTEPESYLDDDVPPIPPMPTSIKSEIDKKIEEKNTDLKKINEKIYYNDINNRSKQIENDIIIKPNITIRTNTLTEVKYY
ncbi:unnamed protein product [Rhizophagus irregularis]|nr:unnamed protein product [Rhizophagus irregularis]